MHAFNLSHPSLSVFLQRSDLLDSLFKSPPDTKSQAATLWCFLRKIMGYLLIVIGILILVPIAIVVLPIFLLFKKKILKRFAQFILNISVVKDSIGKAMRTLTFFEIPLEYQFIVLDYYLKSKIEYFEDEKHIVMGNTAYNKIVLCPLVIDFGRKNIPDGVFYRYTPKSPIANQVGDLLYAIRTYYRFNVNVMDDKMHLSTEIFDWENRKAEKLFEIYPFMGLDTKNYDDWNGLEILLDKYFYEFEASDSPKIRRERLFNKMGKLDSNMYIKTEGHYHNVFAGIKLYPQLGFDPYPDAPEEFEKVKNLYLYCIKKRIPITTHCSDGGYKVAENNHLTSPLGKWKKVLEQKEFEELTLNFAHFGSQKGKQTEWRNAIIELTKKYPNVYTDISCNDMTDEYYNNLGKLFNSANPQLHKKVLFGSDFSINLLVTEAYSYNHYLETFSDAELPYKTELCELNPERFLFGGIN